MPNIETIKEQIKAAKTLIDGRNYSLAATNLLEAAAALDRAADDALKGKT